MIKNLHKGNKFLQKFVSGIKTASEIVTGSLGPNGNFFGFVENDQAFIVNDGVTIIKNINKIKNLSDVENFAIKFLMDVAKNSNQKVGDGSTTSVLLSANLILQTIQILNEGKISRIELTVALKHFKNDILAHLQQLTKTEITEDDVENIARLSSKDITIGKILREAFKHSGKQGIIEVEECSQTETKIEICEGYKFEGGLISHFFQNNKNKMQCYINKPKFLVIKKSFNTVDEVIPILKLISRLSEKKLVICCEGITGEALTVLIFNKMKNNWNICVVDSKSMRLSKEEIMQDISTITGTNVFDKQFDIDSIDEKQLGIGKNIISDSHSTTIAFDMNDRIRAKSQMFKQQIEHLQSDANKNDSLIEKLKFRSGSISNKMVLIKAGANTESSMKHLKLKIEDSINAVRAGIESGIVLGGGKTLINIYNRIYKKRGETFAKIETELKMFESNIEFQNILINLMENFLVSVTEQLLINSALEKSVIDKTINKLLSNPDEGLGIEAVSLELTNLNKHGIITPTKILKSCIEHAFEITSLVMNLGAAVIPTNINNEKKDEHNDSYQNSLI